MPKKRAIAAYRAKKNCDRSSKMGAKTMGASSNTNQKSLSRESDFCRWGWGPRTPGRKNQQRKGGVLTKGKM